MSEEINRNFYCSELSLQANEELPGTTPRVDVWFLLEYRGAWSDNAFVSSKIPEMVKTRINDCLNSIPNSRLQLIKKHDNIKDIVKFYICVSDEKDPKLFEFDLKDYEELLDLDLEAIPSGESNLCKEPIFLVCTNGEYDKCCGKYGVPVYMEAVKHENGFTIWQTTHLGGHRFAANVLFLPYGIYYGRVRETNVPRLVDDSLKLKIRLEHYRGRSCYSKDVQAAEYFLRRKTGVNRVSAFRFKEFKNPDRENSIAEFVSLSDNRSHLVHIQRDKEAFMNYTSCKDGEKSPVTQYRFVEIKGL